jgi:aryl-alcohol dehydrogenase-like predicted oxidoreductase
LANGAGNGKLRPQHPNTLKEQTMQTRTLGPGGLEVSAIGYGAMVLVHGMYGANDDQRSIQTLRHSIDAGATFIDTSDAYGADGHNERLIGRAIAERRDEVQIATKWGVVAGPDERAHRVDASYDNEIWVDARPERARVAAEASLRRLGIDTIDLWYVHFPDPGVPIEETVGAMAELAVEGKVRHLGLSNATVEQVLAASQVHPIAAVQTEYSLWTRDPERELLGVLRELGIGLVAWSPLGSGFFAGSADTIGARSEDFRNNAPRFKPENLAANRDRYAPLRQLASALGITPAQLALAWLLHQGNDIVPIPGTRTPSHLDENILATSVTLDPETLTQIDTVAPPGAAAGASLL